MNSLSWQYWRKMIKLLLGNFGSILINKKEHVETSIVSRVIRVFNVDARTSITSRVTWVFNMNILVKTLAEYVRILSNTQRCKPPCILYLKDHQSQIKQKGSNYQQQYKYFQPDKYPKFTKLVHFLPLNFQETPSIKTIISWISTIGTYLKWEVKSPFSIELSPTKTFCCKRIQMCFSTKMKHGRIIPAGWWNTRLQIKQKHCGKGRKTQNNKTYSNVVATAKIWHYWEVTTIHQENPRRRDYRVDTRNRSLCALTTPNT